ncbi:hypothetical protein PIB30_086732, partial [Stylosanthes scabra]|nr:hypothetical protein [Stylosanthes scabra]
MITDDTRRVYEDEEKIDETMIDFLENLFTDKDTEDEQNITEVVRHRIDDEEASVGKRFYSEESPFGPQALMGCPHFSTKRCGELWERMLQI